MPCVTTLRPCVTTSARRTKRMPVCTPSIQQEIGARLPVWPCLKCYDYSSFKHPFTTCMRYAVLILRSRLLAIIGRRTRTTSRPCVTTSARRTKRMPVCTASIQQEVGARLPVWPCPKHYDCSSFKHPYRYGHTAPLQQEIGARLPVWPFLECYDYSSFKHAVLILRSRLLAITRRRTRRSSRPCATSSARRTKRLPVRRGAASAKDRCLYSAPMAIYGHAFSLLLLRNANELP